MANERPSDRTETWLVAGEMPEMLNHLLILVLPLVYRSWNETFDRLASASPGHLPSILCVISLGSVEKGSSIPG